MITEPALLLASIGDLPPVYWAAPIGALAALVMALIFSKSVMSKPEGDDEMIELKAGDFVSFPPDTGVAHQFVNDGDEPLVYVAFSNRVKGDVCEYPDSNKILVRGNRRRMLRRDPVLEYFDGEVDAD